MNEAPCRVTVIPPAMNQNQICPLYWILRSVEWLFLADVSGQPFGPIFNSQAVHEEYREHLGTRLYGEWVPVFFLESLTLENETDRLYRNVGKKQPFYAAQNPKIGTLSSTQRRKPEVTQWNQIFGGHKSNADREVAIFVSRWLNARGTVSYTPSSSTVFNPLALELDI